MQTQTINFRMEYEDVTDQNYLKIKKAIAARCRPKSKTATKSQASG